MVVKRNARRPTVVYTSGRHEIDQLSRDASDEAGCVLVTKEALDRVSRSALDRQ
jgi:hypothetical protein